jgi:hypothetical protein
MAVTAEPCNGTASPAQPSTDRDPKGRFLPGNGGGPGNPFARAVAALRQTLLRSVSEADMEAITAALVARARAGDPAATKLLFQYVLGKPTETVDPDQLDVDEWQKLQASARHPKEMATVLRHLPVEEVCILTNLIWPYVVNHKFNEPLRATLEESRKTQLAAAEKAARRQAARQAKGQRQPPPANGDHEAAGQPQPSPNGDNGAIATPAGPSPNGGNGAAQAAAPSPNGDNGAARGPRPSPKGGNGAARGPRPSPNGDQSARDAAWQEWWSRLDPTRSLPPSSNGADGGAAPPVGPSPNGDSGAAEDAIRWLRMAREALQRANPPSPNGKNGPGADRAGQQEGAG